MMPIRVARTVSAAGAAIAACCALLIAATPGNAAPTETSYTANGVTHLAGLEADLPLGPGQADVDIDLQTGDLTAEIELPETRTDFTMFGFLPTYAHVQIKQAGVLEGTYRNGAVTVAGDFSVQISEVGHLALAIPMENCRTTEPVSITLESEGKFLPADGGTLTGTYKLPEFADCNFDTPIINALVAGKEHSISIDLASAS
ncbi:hypothetical protein WDH52_17255 [Streptomyces sp. TRM70308]|uniref:hypothetical protein n=1 Tax=Streptomyces sp. TRM70308 TaxID=3131932 RepID=UPI003D027139